MNRFIRAERRIVTILFNIAFLIILPISAWAEFRVPIHPYEKIRSNNSETPLDTYVTTQLNKLGTEPGNLCSDEVFIRRVYLDVIGTLPDQQEVILFLRDQTPNKRARLIDTLLARPEFAEYWALKWCDILRVKSEFPINLWPNAVQGYHHWIRDSIKENKPYTQFVRELLTSSGSNFRVPPVNFYRATQSRDSAGLASAVALTFMGTRLDTWPESYRAGMAAFFSRVAYKKTDEWKEEIVYVYPATTTAIEASFLDSKKVVISPDKDPRQVFADWLITSDNPWFAQNIVNRIWAWLLGKGIINEPDDIRPDNPPANPELLVYLEKELVKSNYDLKHIYRLILNSATYQGTSIPYDTPQNPAIEYAAYQIRRLDAEVLIDAFDWLGGTGESYSSAIPEPYTNIPEYNRTISLADGSITSQFLEMFGRPVRDTGLVSERNNEVSDAQRLYLLNANELQRKIEQSRRLRRIYDNNRKNQANLIRMVYITVLSRFPTPAEIEIANTYFSTQGISQKQAADDLVWVLINTKEFLYRH
ncbi:MAG: DUF1553 domain-containing protein [bacterium]